MWADNKVYTNGFDDKIFIHSCTYWYSLFNKTNISIKYVEK